MSNLSPKMGGSYEVMEGHSRQRANVSKGRETRDSIEEGIEFEARKRWQKRRLAEASGDQNLISLSCQSA